MKPDVSLEDLGAEAVQWHMKAEEAKRDAINSLRTALTFARDCGRALIRAKKKTAHGTWESWVEVNFPASLRTAQDYMKIASNWRFVEAKLHDEPDIRWDKLRRFLRKPKEVIEPTEEEAIRWARYNKHMRISRQIAMSVFRSAVKDWEHSTIEFLAMFPRVSGLLERLREIEAEILPIAEIVMLADHNRRLAMKNNVSEDVAHQAFKDEVKDAFKDKSDLTTYQRNTVDEIVRDVPKSDLPRHDISAPPDGNRVKIYYSGEGDAMPERLIGKHAHVMLSFASMYDWKNKRAKPNKRFLKVIDARSRAANCSHSRNSTATFPSP